MLEVIELHRCAVSEIQASEEFGYLKEEARQSLGQRRCARPEARLSQRAGHRPRADRHDQLPDGLRHHRHRARHRAGEIQTARRRRHVEDRQPDGQARRCEKLGYNSEEIERIIAHIDEFDTIEDVADSRRLDDYQLGLKPEHLPIFDCAFKAYKGERVVRLHGAPPDDGRGAAVPQRRDFQDRQHAGERPRSTTS